MKKIMAVLIAAILSLSCTLSAFAANDTASATPDEAQAKVESYAFKKLPAKTQYTLLEDAGWDFGDITLDQIMENPDIIYSSEYFYIDVDLTGAEIELTYSDGTTALADLADCTTKVSDPLDLSTIPDDATYEEANAMVYRDYTIEVLYKGEATPLTFKVNVAEPNIDLESKYELVSYDIPDANLNYTKDDLYDSYYYDEELDDDIDCKAFEVNTMGMTVTLKNKETGEVVTVSEDDILVDEVAVKDVDKSQTYTVEAAAFVAADDDFDMVEFTMEVNYNAGNNGEKDVPSRKPTDNPESSSVTPSAASATADTVNAGQNTAAGNGAVQTGAPAYAAILAVIMMSGALFTVFFSKKKFSK